MWLLLLPLLLSPHPPPTHPLACAFDRRQKGFASFLVKAPPSQKREAKPAANVTTRLVELGLISAHLPYPTHAGRVPWTSVVLVTLRETARLLLGAAAAGRAY